MEIVVSLWTPGRTGVDPISQFFFHVFLVPHLVPHCGPTQGPNQRCPWGPLPPLLQTGETCRAGHQAEEAGCMEDQQFPDAGPVSSGP